jgi:hypothetical protein
MPNAPGDHLQQMLLMTTHNLVTNNTAQNPFHAIQVSFVLRLGGLGLGF